MATSVELRPYDAGVYNSLPDFSDVAQAFKTRKGKFFIRTVREIFLRHNVEASLGIGLVHRHFDLSAEERLVQDGNTSTPWTTEKFTQSHIIPSAWVFHNGALYPYEFEVVSEGTQAPDLPAAFLEELLAHLKANQYEQTLGINTYDGGPAYEEHTEGRKNILTLIQGDPANDHTAPATWGFFR
ncbi:hypothetical protein BDD12DRAFT_746249 [Trichophaea hybrida]|nr:hypothetical protein BDD12DRAFT_746249 [Trichophaea hybrida]